MELKRHVKIEVLIPDFQGDWDALNTVVKSKPTIINHNLETVFRLYPEVRPMANYKRSLDLLKMVKEMDNSIYTKSGIMLGLGEKPEEVIQVLRELRDVNCDLMTIGQYLAPSDKHHPVVEYIHPNKFTLYKQIGLEMGFKYIASAPMVRSSYHAGQTFKNL